MKITLTVPMLCGVLLVLGNQSGIKAQTPPLPPPPLAVDTPMVPGNTRTTTKALSITPAVPTAPVSGARIQFAAPVYDFGKAEAGQVLKHDYIFTNTGNQTLEIREVRPSCGCTTAGTWERKIEPGQTGSIPIQFNGANFNGPVHKTITVSCNASNQPIVMLEFKGTFWRAVEVNPSYVYFNLVPGAETNPVKTVRIVNNLDTPLTLAEPKITNSVFTVELKPVKPGKEFELTVKVPTTPAPGTHQGSIKIQTSSTNLPVVNITTLAVVQPAVSVLPAQLVLPSGPVLSGTRLGVTIRNNSAGLLAVSKVTVSVPGVETQLREFQAGRIYSVVLSFPAGFELPAGEKAELTFQTSHPQFQTMRVPLVQMARPVQSQLTSPRAAVATTSTAVQVQPPRPVISGNPSTNLPPLPPLPGSSAPVNPVRN